MKLIKSFLFLTVLTFTLQVLAGNPSMPFWMIKVTKTISAGKYITGTGYLVKFNRRLFVRTASHVTLGSADNLLLQDFKGRPVVQKAGRFATNSMNDDQLIEIEESDLQPLAIYNPQLELFLVTKSAFAEARKDRNVSLASETILDFPSYQPSFIVSPPWVKRKQFRFKESPPANPMLKAIGNQGYDEKQDELRPSVGGELLVANVSIIPGESGSPVIGWTPVASLDTADLNFQIKLSQAVKSGLKDENGEIIDTPFDQQRGDSLVVIKGHAIAYHRKLQFSLFSSALALRPLEISFENHLGRDIGGVSWKHESGLTYRIFNGPNEQFAEVFGISDLSGDGTAADGGDGTAADGGDGTAADGADGIIARSGQVGMMYNGQKAVSFKLINIPGLKLGRYEPMRFYFEQQTQLAANWPNFILLRHIQGLNGAKIFEPGLADNLLAFFDRRFNFKIANVFQKEGYSCRISRAKLAQGTVSVEIQLGALKGDEILLYESDLLSFRNLVTFKSKNFKQINADFSRIWGVDIRFMGTQFNPIDDIDPFIYVKSEGSRPEKYDCVLF